MWSEYTRTAQLPPTGIPGAFAPSMPPAPPGGGHRAGAVVAGVAATLVLVTCVAGGVYLLNRDNGDTGPGRAAPTERAPGPQDGAPGEGDDPTDGPQAPDRGEDPGFAVDIASGVSLPVPEGWDGGSTVLGAGLRTGVHPCPGDESQNCLRGGVTSQDAALAGLKATTAEAAAKEDIPLNAESSYGAEGYGGITSHKVLKSGKVTVAGEEGYLVRWQVVTEKGDDGYVQSVVMPSPADPGKLVLLRYGFDVSSEAPDLTVMDEITNGIKAADVSGDGKAV